MKYNLYVDSKTLAQVKEEFKSEVPIQKTKFPIELGEPHPFDFKELEMLYQKFGLATGVIDKYVDFIVGPGFYIKTDSPQAEAILYNFMHDVNFDTILRQWVKQALIKGTSPMELGLKGKTIDGLKVINANNFYIQRDKKGNILGYSQYTGGFNNQGSYDRASKIDFKPDTIAFLTFNQVGDCPYGIGILQPALNIINNILKSEKDMHVLMSRKANSPLHIKLGNMDKDDIPNDSEITNFGQKLEYMTNKQEWCTGPNVEMKVVEFGNLADKFAGVLDHDMQMALYTFQIPEVLMGKGSIPEGLAGVQMDAFMRRVQSFQAEIEKIIETQIFDRILLNNNLMVDVEFEWGQPSNAEKNEKIRVLTSLLSLPMLSSAMYKELESQLALLLGIDPEKLDTPEEQRDKEEEEPQPKIPKEKTKSGFVKSKVCNCEEHKPALYDADWFEGELLQ